MRLALEMAARQQNQSMEETPVDWTSVMLNCTKSYPELFTPYRNPNEGDFEAFDCFDTKIKVLHEQFQRKS